MTPFPWGEAMRLGLGVLRLSPDVFWRMTPRELAAAASGLDRTNAAGRPIERARFEALQRRFPDHSLREEQKNG